MIGQRTNGVTLTWPCTILVWLAIDYVSGGGTTVIQRSDLQEIPRVDARGLRGGDLPKFQEPVIFTHMTDDWRARQWSRPYLARHYPHVVVTRSTLPKEIFRNDSMSPWEANSLYADHLRNSYSIPIRPLVGMRLMDFAQDENHNDYVFDIAQEGAGVELSRDIKLPDIFVADDVVQMTFGMGPSNEGVMFHCHTGAWNALMNGEKTWLFYHPEGFCGKQYDHLAFASSNLLRDRVFGSNAGWPSDAVLPTVAHQKAGEVVYIPDGWWHATFSHTDSICIGGQRHRNRLEKNYWYDLLDAYPLSGLALRSVALNISKKDPKRAQELFHRAVSLEPLNTMYHTEYLEFLSEQHNIVEATRTATQFSQTLDGLRNQSLLTGAEQAAILSQMGGILVLAVEGAGNVEIPTINTSLTNESQTHEMAKLEAVTDANALSSKFAHNCLELDPECKRGQELMQFVKFRSAVDQNKRRELEYLNGQALQMFFERRQSLASMTSSYDGYLQILNFTLNLDVDKRVISDWLSPKRNVGILSVGDQYGRLIYKNFAISGDKTPGAQLAPASSPLKVVEVPENDTHSDVPRHDESSGSGAEEASINQSVVEGRFDASFKLLADFHNFTRGKRLGSTRGILWLAKKQCVSGEDAVQQMRKLVPDLYLQILIAEPDQVLESKRIIDHFLNPLPRVSRSRIQKAKDLPEMEPGLTQFSVKMLSIPVAALLGVFIGSSVTFGLLRFCPTDLKGFVERSVTYP